MHIEFLILLIISVILTFGMPLRAKQNMWLLGPFWPKKQITKTNYWDPWKSIENPISIDIFHYYIQKNIIRKKEYDGHKEKEPLAS